MSASLPQRLRFLPSPKTTVNWPFSLQLVPVSMADKIARCPASANSTNSTIATLQPLCSRSIVDDVYTTNVPLAFLTVIYAHPLSSPSTLGPLRCLTPRCLYPFRFTLNLVPDGRFTPPRIHTPSSFRVAILSFLLFASNFRIHLPIVLFTIFTISLLPFLFSASTLPRLLLPVVLVHLDSQGSSSFRRSTSSAHYFSHFVCVFYRLSL